VLGAAVVVIVELALIYERLGVIEKAADHFRYADATHSRNRLYVNSDPQKQGLSLCF
jgi:hypothetical protein